MEDIVRHQRRELFTALFFMVLINVFWGTSFPLVKTWFLLVDFPEIEPGASYWRSICSTLSYLSVRFLIASLALAALFPHTIRDIRRESFLAGMEVGAAFFAGLLCQALGLALIGATRSALITALTVLVTPWISAVWFRRVPSARMLTACVLSFAGAAILVEFAKITPDGITWDQSAIGLGDLLTFAGTCFFSVGIFLIDGHTKRGVTGMLSPGMFASIFFLSTATAIAIGASLPGLYEGTSRFGLVVGPLRGLSEYVMVFSSVSSFVLFILLTVPSITLGFYWMNKYQGHFSPSHAAVIYTLEPLMTALWSLFLPGELSALLGVDYPSEVLTAPIVIGGVIILIANILPSLEE